ncbi:Rieske 2Fe-2S domain-containing protein [Streptomyces sp. LaPpAH-108]|uniref:Rieske 2Fe-2S domain-containing protein n=1 Tax=Streptomyces sp. LaPpAH-108 TaxID=1155714 RepID=UPI0003601A4B|nr:Rieske 2Fe-2S domain-containing protein [Streptomyces sp. LaPpAH-108]
MPKLVEDAINEIGNMQVLDGPASKAAGLVGRATRDAPVKDALSGTWLGHALHPVLTDLPIGAWSMATVLDLTAGKSGTAAAQRLIGFGLLATVPTAATGASDWADTYGPPQRVGLVHAVGNSAATVVQASSWLVRRAGHHRAGAALSLLGLGIAAGAAYLGGHLSFVDGVGVSHTAFQEPASDWTEVVALAELSENKLVRCEADGVPVVVVRHDGKVYALSDTCTHAGGPLHEGKVTSDGCVQCPWHGSEFRLDDGEAVRGPASVHEPDWEVKVVSGRVHVRPVQV